MKRPSLAVAVAVAGLALGGGLAACGSSDNSTTGGGGGGGNASFDLVIGDSVPLTGDLADFGPPGQKAAALAVSEINKAIKETGVDETVTLKNADNETNPQGAVNAARTLASSGANCILGAWASSDTIPTFRSVSSREGILQISPASTSDEISGLKDPDHLLNRTAPPDRFQGPTLADAIAEDLGGAEGKTVNIGARNDSYGNGLAKTFSDAWEKAGGKIGQTVIYDPAQPSYNSEADKITSGKPDAFVIIDFPETFVKVGPALERTGNWDPTIAWGTDGLAASDLPKQVGKQVVEGMRGTAPGVPDANPASQAFKSAYKAFAPKNVGRQTFDAQNFDAAVLCYLSAVAAGSSDGKAMAAELEGISGPGGQQYTWQQLPEAIKALENGDDIDYEGASGPVDLNEDGDATAGVYDVYQYKNGAIETVSEVPVDQG